MYHVYGIPNCDTIKKTLDWLNAHKVPYEFHNYKKEGINSTLLQKWSKQVSWEILLNKKGTTWRELDDKTKASITTEKAAIQLMSDHTSSIKRPVITKADKVITVGFNSAEYETLLK